MASTSSGEEYSSDFVDDLFGEATGDKKSVAKVDPTSQKNGQQSTGDSLNPEEDRISPQNEEGVQKIHEIGGGDGESRPLIEDDLNSESISVSGFSDIDPFLKSDDRGDTKRNRDKSESSDNGNVMFRF